MYLLKFPYFLQKNNFYFECLLVILNCFREKASAFWNALQPMAKEFENIETMQLADVEDILEACYEVLDDLWKLDDYLYPQQRMIHLMDIIAHAVTRFIQSKLTLLDLWQGKYSEVDAALNQVNLTSMIF